jgi:small-conductance mechanosensitive channel
VRLLSLLFRPLFLDAQGAFGLIASLENVFIIVLLVTLFRNFGQLMRMIRQVFFIRFAAVFALILIVLLSLVYYNVGLGLRQKIMFMPALLTMFVAVLAVRRSETRAPALSYA